PRGGDTIRGRDWFRSSKRTERRCGHVKASPTSQVICRRKAHRRNSTWLRCQALVEMLLRLVERIVESFNVFFRCTAVMRTRNCFRTHSSSAITVLQKFDYCTTKTPIAEALVRPWIDQHAI